MITTQQIAKENGNGTRKPSPLKSIESKKLLAELEKLAGYGAITERDEQLFGFLRELNVLSCNQVQRLLWLQSKEESAYRRLTLLCNRHLLHRVGTPRSEMKRWGLPAVSSRGRGDMIYTLGVGGRLWLKDKVNHFAGKLKRDQVVHDLLTAELCVRLTEAGYRRGKTWTVTIGGERTASFYEQKKDNMPVLAPDGLAIVRQQQSQSKIATLSLLIEMDASREAHGRPSSDWGRKVHGYDRFYAGKWQHHDALNDLKTFPRVLVVTHGQRRLLNLADAIIKHRKKPVVYYLGLWQDIIAGQDILTVPAWLIVTPEGQVIGREQKVRRSLLPSRPKGGEKEM